MFPTRKQAATENDATVLDVAALEWLIVFAGPAVPAMPERLSAIMTTTLAIAVQCMAARNVVIRRLPKVETLGTAARTNK